MAVVVRDKFGNIKTNTTMPSGVYKTTPSGLRAVQVFDTEKYNAFAQEKQRLAEIKKQETEGRISKFEAQRQRQLSQQELARRKQRIGRERIEKQPSQFTGRRTTVKQERFKGDIFNFGQLAKKDVYETKVKEYGELEKDINKINKELAEYKPMKTVYVSSYIYVSPEGKRQSISFDAAKNYEKSVKDYQKSLEGYYAPSVSPLNLYETTSSGQTIFKGDISAPVFVPYSTPSERITSPAITIQQINKALVPDARGYVTAAIPFVGGRIEYNPQKTEFVQAKLLRGTPLSESEQTYTRQLVGGLELGQYISSVSAPKTSRVSPINLINEPSRISFENQDVPLITQRNLDNVIYGNVRQGGLSLDQQARFDIYKPQTDITLQEFDKRLRTAFKDIQAQAGFESTVLQPNLKGFQDINYTQFEDANLFAKGYDFNLSTSRKATDSNIFESPGKQFVGQSFDYGTDFFGYALRSIFGTSRYTTDSYPGFKSLQAPVTLRYKVQGIKNPLEATIMDLEKTGKQNLINQSNLEFFLGKQATETGMFLAGSPYYTAATIGSLGRAKNYEELALPVLFGAGGRIAAPVVGGKLAGLIPKINAKIGNIETKFLSSKLPVMPRVLVPSRVSNLVTEGRIAKSILLGGGGAEVGGIYFTPEEQRKEYVRQIGLFNAATPLAYRATDVGIALGKYAGIKGIYKGLEFAGKLTKKDLLPYDIYSTKELMYEELYEKFSRTGGGTPTFVGTEEEMLRLSQGENPFGVGAVFRRYGIDAQELGVGAGLRSIGYKPKNVEIAMRNYYESLGDYYSDVLHPIALKNVGLKNRLFGSQGSIYDDFRLAPNNPNVKFTGFEKAGVLPDLPFNEKVYRQAETAFGYKPMDFSFSEDVFFKKTKIPKGMTLEEFQFQKIQGGGRPIKTGDFLGAGFSDDVFEEFVMFKDSKASRFEGAVSSRPRFYKTTSEREFIIPQGTKDVRLKPFTSTRAKFRKLGFSDFYVDVGFEYVPGTYRQVQRSLPTRALLESGQRLLTGEGQKQITGKDQLYFQSTSLTKTNKGLQKMTNDLMNTNITKRGTGKGGYTQELERVFGGKNVFSKVMFPVYKPGKLSRSYLNVYQPSYSPKYNPFAMPKYAPKRMPDYTPTYVPKRTPGYTPERMPDYTPQYTLDYRPFYAPKYTPRYDQVPRPKYTPEYFPTYKPRYTPKKTIPLNGGFDYEPSKDISGTFVPYVRRNNNTKWVRASKTALPYNAAFNVGLNVADNTTARSVKLKRSSKSFNGLDDPFIIDQKFRRRKSRSKIPGEETIFVEKNQFAIDTIGEKQGLKASKYLKQGGVNAWGF